MGRTLKGSVCFALAMALSAPGYAQNAAPPKPAAVDDDSAASHGDIVVTAEKRSQRLQKVAGSVSAVGVKEIAEARIESVKDLALVVPGLTISDNQGSIGLNLRGLGFEFVAASQEAAVITNIDGVYLARPAGTAPAFNDLERIEVLRGPEGTLYGRNATGGVLNIITKTPGDEFKLNGGITLGTHARKMAYAGVDIPLAQTLSARFSVFTDNNNGDVHNLYTGATLRDLRSFGVRGVLQWVPSNKYTAILRADYFHDRTAFAEDFIAPTPAGSPLGVTPLMPGGIYQDVLNITPTIAPQHNGRDFSANFLNPYIKHKLYGTSLTQQLSLSDTISLKSITAYRITDIDRDFDGDSSSAATLEYRPSFENSKQFTQEINLNGTTRGVQWVAGTYYFNEKTDYLYLFDAIAAARAINYAMGLPPGTIPSLIDFNGYQKSRSISGFGQATVPVTDAFHLTGGLRYNHDSKKANDTESYFGGSVCDLLISRHSWNDITWTAGADYSPAEHNLIFAKATKGFRSGGYNVGGCGNVFNPETVISYEAGVKNTFLDGNVLLNISVFHYDYKNLQTTKYTQTSADTVNAANAKITGVDLELRVTPVRGLDISADGTRLITANFANFINSDPLNPAAGQQDFSGFRIPHSPKLTATGTVAYHQPLGHGTLTLRYDIRYNSGWYGEFTNNELMHQHAYAVQNARIAYRLGATEFGAFVENLGDKLYASELASTTPAGSIYANWAPLRTAGVFLTTEFK